MRRVLLPLLAAGLLAAGCSDSEPSSTPGTPVATPTASATATGPPPATTRPAVRLTLAFGGDVHAAARAQTALTGGLTAITPLLSRADISMVNLETAITTRGRAEPKAFNFRAPLRLLTRLRQAGVDLVTGANNHGYDFGAVGLADTLAAERTTGLPIIGLGRDASEAFAPQVVTVRGARVAFLAATQVLDASLAARWSAGPAKPGLANAQDPTRLLAAVRTARRSADVVVVFLHYGTERVTCPTTRQRTIAAQLAAAGADVVVGSHAHRLLGAGRLGTTYVAYGLGNFVFSTAPGQPGAQTGVLRLTLQGRRVVRDEWLPATIRSGVPHPLSGPAAVRAVRSWEALRGCTGLIAVP